MQISVTHIYIFPVFGEYIKTECHSMVPKNNTLSINALIFDSSFCSLIRFDPHAFKIVSS